MLMGDGMQRLAHYFANELEARLDGSRSQICKAVITKPSTTHFLKVYHLLLAVCLFLNKKKMSLISSPIRQSQKQLRKQRGSILLILVFSIVSHGLHSYNVSQLGLVGLPSFGLLGLIFHNLAFDRHKGLKRQGIG